MKAIVLMSGGLDSTVCATKACQNNEEVKLLMFNYGQKMLSKEMEAVKNVAEYLEKLFPDVVITREVVALNFLRDLGGSYLTEHDKPVTEGDEALQSPTAWTPARNLIMVSIAGAYCDARKFDRIYIGINAEEGETYPDNTAEFRSAMNSALQYGVLQNCWIEAPLASLNKNEIVEFGNKIKAPIKMSWSCYYTQEKHCGRCASCQIKKAAFEKNNMLINEYWENELFYVDVW